MFFYLSQIFFYKLSSVLFYNLINVIMGLGVLRWIYICKKYGRDKSVCLFSSLLVMILITFFFINKEILFKLIN